jgi:hypothetical protein
VVDVGELRNRVIIHLAQTILQMCTTGVGPSQPMRKATLVRIGQHHAQRSIGTASSRAAQQVIKVEHWSR